MSTAAQNFDQCNQRLLDRNVQVDMPEYVLLTQIIPSGLDVIDNRLPEAASLIHFMINISDVPPHQFAISVHVLERLGFFVKDTVANRARTLFGMLRDDSENEVAFLKKNHIKLGVEYELVQTEIDPLTNESCYECKVTPIAFHKLMGRKYDQLFLAALHARLIQISRHYQAYIAQQQLVSMQDTIRGLTTDIHTLLTEYPIIKHSSVFARGSGAPAQMGQGSEDSDESSDHDICPCIRRSFGSDYSMHGTVKRPLGYYDSPRDSMEQQMPGEVELHGHNYLWSPQSDRSPITTVLESPQFSAQLNAIHASIANFTRSPNDSLDSGHLSAMKSTGEFDPDHVDVLRRRFATFLSTSPIKRNAPVRRSAN